MLARLMSLASCSTSITSFFVVEARGGPGLAYERGLGAAAAGGAIGLVTRGEAALATAGAAVATGGGREAAPFVVRGAGA